MDKTTKFCYYRFETKNRKGGCFMDISYNTQEDFASNIKKFFINIGITRKTWLNIMPYIIFGMIIAESVVTSDIAKKLKDKFSFIQHESVCRRINRFFKSKTFDIYAFFDLIIKNILINYHLKHIDGKINIAFDHMYCKDRFTILMFTLRIGKQSIPLWFRCFKGKHDEDAFQEELFKQGINYCIHLFDHIKKKKIIFTADRFFNSATLLSYIGSNNCYYCVRLRKNGMVLVYDKKEGHTIWKSIDELTHYVYKPVYYRNIIFTREHRLQAHIVISKSKDLNEPWYLITNLNPSDAVRTYSKRFGSIEFFFKSQKSNGFYLESTTISDLKSFETMYGLCCFSVLFLNIIGVSYCKNAHSRQYKHVKIKYMQNTKDKTRERIRSNFEIGLILFNKACYSHVYIYIPYTFKLYDV